jgi:signal transduction histidine kinase
MKLRLFWTMLLAFVLVIVLGIVGTFFAFGIAVMLADRDHTLPAPPMLGRFSVDDAPPALADSLGDYYTAHGNSWEGLDARLAALGVARSFGAGGLVVLDAEGRTVASGIPAVPLGRPFPADQQAQGRPILVRGEQVGTLLFVRGRVVRAEYDGPPPIFWRLAQGMFAGMLGLAAVLLGLAIVFSGRISRPLRRLTEAAQALAAGQREVQVEGTSVREIDELARSFNRMARSLADADRQRRQMTADIAHELRTPLAVIKGRLEGMQDGIYDATPEQVGRLLAETALLERLIEDLRLLALAEAGQLPLYPEPTEPVELIERAAAAFADQATRQRVTLLVDAEEGLPEIAVDAQRIAQVLTNLVANALRFTPPGGTIALRARALPGEAAEAVVVEVADSGAGIAPEHLPHVFERFYRADRARGRASGGAGLGLAIARQIVASHGGEIVVSSTPGVGTTFTLTLPVSAALVAA